MTQAAIDAINRYMGKNEPERQPEKQTVNRKLITAKEREVLTFIKGYAVEKNYLPTIREIGEGVGLRSTSSVQHYMLNLENKGYIVREQGRERRYAVKGLRYVVDE